MMNTKEKVRENRFRRMLHRRGYALCKSKTRDPRALGYGMYCIVDSNSVVVAGVVGRVFHMTLDDVEKWLEDE